MCYVSITGIADLSENSPVVALQGLKIWLGMEHHILQTRALHMATGVVKEVTWDVRTGTSSIPELLPG